MKNAVGLGQETGPSNGFFRAVAHAGCGAYSILRLKIACMDTDAMMISP